LGLRRFYVIFTARNKEYYRDREAFGWNFVFPFLIILGFALMFQRGAQTPYKIGLVDTNESRSVCRETSDRLSGVDFFETVHIGNRSDGVDKLKRHRLDLLLECGHRPPKYWIIDSSPKGKIAEGLLLKALGERETLEKIGKRQLIRGKQAHYIDWLFPGIIAMNAMFSALFGVGYIVVRYRKQGVLKRFKATPLTPFEYLAAQVMSRLIVLIGTNFIVFAGCTLIFDFKCEGSYLDLTLLFALGCASLISLSLIIAARSSSEEFANGVLNFVAWPMMFLSEVWFSLEGAPRWIQTFAQFLPLTHVTEGMRRIMNDGAGLSDLGYQLAVLAVMTVVFMSIGSALFKWTD